MDSLNIYQIVGIACLIPVAFLTGVLYLSNVLTIFIWFIDEVNGFILRATWSERVPIILTWLVVIGIGLLAYGSLVALP